MGAPDAATTAERSTSVSTTMPRSACRRAARTLGRQGRLLQPGHGFRSGAPQPDQVHRRRSASERAGCRALTSRDTGKAARCGVLSPTPFRALAGPGPPAAGGCARVRCWPRQPAKQPAWIPRSRRAADLAADDRARAGGHRARVLRVGHMVGEPAVGVQELAACAALLVAGTARRGASQQPARPGAAADGRPGGGPSLVAAPRLVLTCSYAHTHPHIVP